MPASHAGSSELAPGLILHDGSALTAVQVATRIKSAVPAWELRASRDTIEIRPDRPSPDLLWELSRPDLSIAVEASDGTLLGTGPFRIDRTEAGRAIELRSHDAHRGGRPFLDRVVVRMGRSLADQLLDLELGRADLVSVAPRDVRRLTAAGLQLAATRPLELVAIVRDRSAAASATTAMRALSLAIDRDAITAVLLERQAEPAGALLPEWLSGYAPVLAVGRDVAAARAIARSLGPADRSLSLQFDANDPAARSVAERVTADAREADLQVRLAGWQRGPRPPADLMLVRVALGATSPERALAAVADALDLRQPDPNPASLLPTSPVASLEDVARAELQLLDAAVVIPLAHQRSLYGIGRRVRGWSGPVISPATGRWNLADAWLAPETP